MHVINVLAYWLVSWNLDRVVQVRIPVAFITNKAALNHLY